MQSPTLNVLPFYVNIPLDNCLIDIPSSTSINSELIDRLIAMPSLAHDLKALAISVASLSDLIFYTDSSLICLLDYIDVMGMGWICVHNEFLVFAASSTLWPSSTKAEILACLTALITAPPKAMITIFSDSQSTIDSFQ